MVEEQKIRAECRNVREKVEKWVSEFERLIPTMQQPAINGAANGKIEIAHVNGGASGTNTYNADCMKHEFLVRCTRQCDRVRPTSKVVGMNLKVRERNGKGNTKSACSYVISLHFSPFLSISNRKEISIACLPNEEKSASRCSQHRR
jgi:hypothetical protein